MSLMAFSWKGHCTMATSFSHLPKVQQWKEGGATGRSPTTATLVVAVFKSVVFSLLLTSGYVFCTSDFFFFPLWLFLECSSSRLSDFRSCLVLDHAFCLLSNWVDSLT